jgi:hypothetical protein
VSIYHEDKKFLKLEFAKEADLESLVFANATQIFGDKTILITSKKMIESSSLGKAIPDAFLFDFSDIEAPQFYLVEVELATHSFYSHIFPQITKFFGFLRDGNHLQTELVEKLYLLISENLELNKKFKKFVVGQELYKFLKDTIEDSKNILLIIDGMKKEIPEIMQTYTDTWDKYVRVLTLNAFKNGDQSIFTVNPDFDEVLEGLPDKSETEDEFEHLRYTEEFHLENKSDVVKKIYRGLRDGLQDLEFNPQKYYISVKNGKNIAFLKFTNKKVRVVIMKPEKEVAKSVKQYKLSTPSQSVQDFYNGSCSYIQMTDTSGIDEVVKAIRSITKAIGTKVA